MSGNTQIPGIVLESTSEGSLDTSKRNSTLNDRQTSLSKSTDQHQFQPHTSTSNGLGPPLRLWTPSSANDSISKLGDYSFDRNEIPDPLSPVQAGKSSSSANLQQSQIISHDLFDNMAQDSPDRSTKINSEARSDLHGSNQSSPSGQGSSRTSHMPPIAGSTIASSSSLSSSSPSSNSLKPALQRLSMLNTSTVVSPFATESPIEYPALRRSISPLARSNDNLTPSFNEMKKRPMSTLMPREATGSPALLQRSSSRQDQSLPISPEILSDETNKAHPGMTAWEFLNAEPPPKGRSGPGLLSVPNTIKSKTGKGKQRAEVPIMELRILPMADTINMFGSTQTSSNYSLSGKVVVRVHNIVREVSAPPSTKSTNSRSNAKRKDDVNETSSLWLPEINTGGSMFMDPEEIFSNHLGNIDMDGVSEALRVQEVNVMSLSCTFSGFALYVDHSGRFSACKLTEVTEELLPRGYKVSIPELGKSQEYEIDFNLSLPGWLPGSLFTRFGGTFYSLEVRAKYSAIDGGELQHAIPSSLVPPRRGSMLPDSSSSDGQSDSEGPSVPLHWQRSTLPPNATIASDEDDVRQGGSRKQAKGRSDSTPPAGKSTWLGKRAKQLATITRSGTASPPPMSSSPNNMRQTATNVDSNSFNENRMPPKLFASRGYISAFSDPVVIIVRRCREVVPVPVARMAVIGADGASNMPRRDPVGSMRTGISIPAAALDEVMRNQLPLPPLPAPIVHDARQDQQSLPLPPPPPPTSLQGPPVAPNTFDLPSDPAKAAQHVASSSSQSSNPNAPQRTSSAPNPPSQHSSHGFDSHHPNAPPMRHFLHRPMLHPPADANIPNASAGLPFSLTLSLPSHVAIDGPGSDILNFGVQIEVGRSPTWTRVRELGGLRLRDMELSCIQTERHCSIASRTFCHAYPMPPEPRVDPEDLPVFGPLSQFAPNGRHLTSSEVRQRRGYDRGLVQYHLDLLQSGRAPHPSANNVERVRTVVVGPPPTPVAKSKSNSSRGQTDDRSGNKDSDIDRAKDNRKDARRRSMQGSHSLPDVYRNVVGNGVGVTGSTSSVSNGEGANATSRSRAEIEELSPEDMPNESSSRRNTGRGRRAYQSAMRGLSNFATAVMDISFDMDGSGYQTNDQGNIVDGRGASDAANDGRNPTNSANQSKSTKNGTGSDSSRAALYSFAGSDGHGVDLTRGRVRMAIKLPLVTSDASRAKSTGTPQLISDFESPFTKTRHKLQVKLGFGFGSKPLGGDGEWGQSLVMCVPVRFTEAAPKEVREQFAPLPVRQIAALSNGPSSSTQDGLRQNLTAQSSTLMLDDSIMATSPGGSAIPILPSYNQLFREDGSRLADEGEDLPQYPGPDLPQPAGGSVTGPGLPDGSGIGENGSDLEEIREELNPSVSGGPELTATVPGALPVRARTSSLADSTNRPGSSNAEAGSSRLPFHDNRITPSHVLDESIPADVRGNASRALQRAEIEEMHREEREAEARRMRRISSRNEGIQDGVEIATESMQLLHVQQGERDSGAESGQEGDLSDSERTRMMEEMVNMDDLENFDDEVPAFALGRLAPHSGLTASSSHNRNSMLPTVFNQIQHSPLRSAGGDDGEFSSTRIGAINEAGSSPA